MDKNRVNLEDIVWVIGVREKKDGRKIFQSIPYVIEESIKGYEDLIDLTESWATVFSGKVTEQDIIEKFEKVHNVKAIRVLKSEDAIKLYILNHDNIFKNQIERIIALDIDQSIKNYCAIKVLNIQEGSDLIREMKEGVKIRYENPKEVIKEIL